MFNLPTIERSSRPALLLGCLVEEKRKSIGIRIEASTYPVYPTALGYFKDFLRGKYEVDDIPFGKVDVAMISGYRQDPFPYYKINILERKKSILIDFSILTL